jgi:hypothetical protein
VRVDQQHRLPWLGQHGVLRQAQQQRRLAAARLGDQQQMATQQVIWQRYCHALPLVARKPDTTGAGNGAGQRQPAAGRCPLEQRDIGRGVRQVP